MITITWGTGGTYATPRLARLATPATWATDYEFLQVGPATESAGRIDLSDRNQNGFKMIIRGNKADTYTHSYSSGFIRLQGATGDVIVEDLTFTTTNSGFANFGGASGWVNTSYKFTVRRCVFTMGSDYLMSSDGGSVISSMRKIELYACKAIFTTINQRDLIANSYGNWSIASDTTFFIEDILYGNSTTAICNILSDILMSSSTNHTKFLFSRCYSNDIESTTKYPASAPPAGHSMYTELFFASNEPNVNVNSNHKNISYSTANFISLDPANAGYLIPRSDSILYTGASQDTNIPENVTGINGVTITHRAVSPYASPEQVPAVTGLASATVHNGVLISWNPAPDPDFPRSFIYWEKTNAPTAFVSPKATVTAGVNQYLIPTEQLAGASTWYVDVRHGE